MKRKLLLSAAVLSMLTIGGVNLSQAAFDENLNMYTLDAVVVEADKTKNKFGDTITEQSYYRTGGDVKVITREEIEKRHYTDATDAIKRIPGVTFTNPGYRGGEYNFNAYNNSMAINGDTRVIVLVDGRRVDNSTSTRFGSSNAGGGRTMVDLNQVVSMEDVEKIEVIKGPGASIYGADATGGVINFITRKGTTENTGTIDLATGSWKKHVYNISYSGAAGNDKSWKYFVSATRNMSGDSKYHDGVMGKDYTYDGTGYKEEGASVRIDKEFNDKQNLKIWYNHQNGKDSYPITARDYRYWNEAEWNRIIQDTENGKYGINNPGYRNLFSLDALSGSYNAYRTNDLDITYTFNKDNGMESFVRFYDQKHHYWGRDIYPDWVDGNGKFCPFPGSAEWDSFISDFKSKTSLEPTRIYNEHNRGVQLQYGKSVGKHDILGSVTFDKASTSTVAWKRATNTWSTTKVERDSILGFVQDKIHLTDKWDLTPAIRYSHYSTYDQTNADGKTSVDNSSSSTFTPAINTEYAFSDSLSAYFGWTKVYRPVKMGDYTDTRHLLNGIKLEDEKGDAWTLGIRKDISDKTSVALHYDWTKMSNAITSYSVWVPAEKEFLAKYVNAKETKQSINLTVDHQINDKWNISLAYSHLKDKWSAKDGMTFDPDIGLDTNSNVNTMINALRPKNHYVANISYECNKWYTGLLVNWYTGCNTQAFTDNRFLVMDWNLNYEITKDWTAYVTVTNLTNEAYENAYYASYGLGAAPQPGRAWMVGAKYKF